LFKMVFPKMRMDCARRRKYALFACGMHTFAAFCLFVSEANYLLMLPLLVRGITRFFVHGRAVNYLLGIQPFVASVLQALMLALHVYSIVAFAEQRESYSRWKPRYLLKNHANKLIQSDNSSWRHCSENGCYMPHSCCMPSQLRCSPRILLQNLTKNERIGAFKAKEWFYSTGKIPFYLTSY
uniref:Dolichyl-P-Glc:Glc(2)Man(9)GlcNAc(2)-PP-dolichol alpha-1,2-glucosyltransferase n=1 Tax=Gongylonema pulchrum TaxID=637853 RepID=A0A183DW44_9BILA